MAGLLKKVKEAAEVAKDAGSVHTLSPFEEMEHAFDRLFRRGWISPYHWPSSLWSEWEGPLERRLLPRVDVIDRKHALVLKAQVPGVKKEDLDVSVTDSAVTIKGSTSHEEKEEKDDYYRRECSHGSFSRTIPLPENVDSTKVKATFKDGMLELTIPKTEKSKRRNISID